MRPRVMRGPPLFGVAVGLTVAVLAVAVLQEFCFHGTPDVQRWTDGTAHGPWEAVFDGEGRVGTDNGSIILSPRRSRLPAETHAALVVSRTGYRNVALHARLRTVAQLRKPTPNPWEVAWLIWAYTDDEHFYYLILKPNGWELGKRDPRYPGGQQFLATGGPVFPPHTWYTVDVAQNAGTMAVRVDGTPLITQTDPGTPYSHGGIGLYCEDAVAEFRNVTAHSL